MRFIPTLRTKYIDHGNTLPYPEQNGFLFFGASAKKCVMNE